jgi:ribonuclease III
MTSVSQLFKNQELLDRALTHRSYINEHPQADTSNERLEFLGDSVLSLIISHRLFILLPGSPEGELTNRRSWLVQTSSLATKSLLLGLNQLLHLSKGEEESGGRTNTGLLANTFEAVLGALYLDQGLDACHKFITEVFPDGELMTPDQIKDPKSLLQEKTQSSGWGTPIYEMISSTGPDHARKFVCSVMLNGKSVATGEGTSKQRAEIAAAAAALSALW